MAVLQDLWQFLVSPHNHSYEAAEPEERAPFRKSVPSEASSGSRVTHVLSARVRYVATHPTTVAIRSYLQSYDPHLVRRGPLTTHEWLTYVLLLQKASVPALALYLTPIGSWHTTLKGQPGSVIGIVPRTHALVEWTESPQMQKAGLVLFVTPAEVMTIGQLQSDGLYVHTTYDREQWLELRPVFTTV